MGVVFRDVRVGAAISLYQQYRRITARRFHSAERREEVEHALGLLWNPKRHAERVDYLLRSVRRDARRISQRRLAARPYPEPLNEEASISAGLSPDPEQLLLAKERHEQFRSVLREVGPDAEACFEDLNNSSAEVRALRQTLAPRRVKYLRAQVRTRMHALLLSEATP